MSRKKENGDFCATLFACSTDPVGSACSMRWAFMSRHIGEDEHSTAAGNTGRAPEHVASPGAELSDGSPHGEVTRRHELAEDGRWMPGTTRGGIPQDGSTPPHPSLLPLQ